MRHARWWALLSGFALLVAAVPLLAPTGARETCGAGDPASCVRGWTSLLSSEGWWIVAPLSVPALACLLPALAASRLLARAVAIGLVVFCLVTGFSIGVFFLPVALAGVLLAFRKTGDAPVAAVRAP